MDNSKVEVIDMNTDDVNNIISNLKHVQSFLDCDKKFNTWLCRNNQNIDIERVMYSYDLAKYIIDFASDEIEQIIEKLESTKIINIVKKQGDAINE